MEHSKLETIIKLLSAIQLAASLFAGIFSWLIKDEIPEEAIAILLIFAVLFYSLYAYLRLARNAPLPFPRLLWQIIFNEVGATEGKHLTRLRFAVVSAPDVIDFAHKLAESENQKAYITKIAESDRQNPAAYSSDRIVIDLTNTKEDDLPKFEYLISNIQAMILIWTDEWLKYRWALKAISMWSRRYPTSPFVVVPLEEGKLPQELQWANKEIFVKDVNKYLNERTPTEILLSQAYTRFRYLSGFTSRARNTALFSWILLIAISFCSYFFIDKLMNQTNRLKNVSGQSINDYSLAIDRAKTVFENLISERHNYNLQQDDSLTNFTSETLEEFKSFILNAQNATEKLISNNFIINANVEVTIFVRTKNNDIVYFCEAFYVRGDFDCFPSDSSIISCAIENNCVVHWQYDEVAPEKGFIKTWTLTGEEIPKHDFSNCLYFPDKAPEDHVSLQERKEILCFPIAAKINKEYSSNVGVAISMEESTGELADPILRSYLISSLNLIGMLPWKWFAENEPHIGFKNAGN